MNRAPSIHYSLTMVATLHSHISHLCDLARSLGKCAALWRAVYAPFATYRPLGTIRKEKGISSRFRVSISIIGRDMTLAVESDVKTQNLPSFLLR